GGSPAPETDFDTSRAICYNQGSGGVLVKRWRDILFDNGFEEHYHIHVGMRIIKTALAVFICGLIGWLRGEMTFFSMIAAVICIQKSTEATIKNSFNRVVGTAVGGAFGVAL